MARLIAREEAELRKVSATEMTLQDIRLTLAMDAFLHEEFLSFRPDVVYSDCHRVTSNRRNSDRMRSQGRRPGCPSLRQWFRLDRTDVSQ